MDLVPKRQAVQVVAQEHRLHRSAEFGESLVGRVLDVGAGKASEDGLGFGGAEPECRRVLDHLVVLLADQPPVDRPRQHRLEVWIVVRPARFGTVEALLVNPFEPRQELKAEEPAEGKGNGALAMTVDVLPIDFHFGAVTDYALDHGRHLRGGRRLELGMDAQGLPLDVPVNHDAAPTVADMPLGHEVLVPGAEVFGV